MAPPSGRAAPAPAQAPRRSSTCRHWSRWPGSSALTSAAASEFDALLALHAGAERMFYQRHLGDEIGHLDQFRFCISSSDDDVLVGGFFLAQESQDLVQVEIVVAQHDVEFIEQHHAVA